MIDATKIHKYVRIGRKDKDWYTECSKVFIDLFGEDQLRLVSTLFAATSINTSLKANIYLFRKAYLEYTTGAPIGSYLPNIVTQLHHIRNNEPISGRKINNFANAMSGDPNAVVVDVWLLRAFGIDTKRVLASGRVANASPTKKQYDLIEGWIKDVAPCMEIEPRQLCAMIWSGVRIATNGDRETHYKTLLYNHFNNLFNVV